MRHRYIFCGVVWEQPELKNYRLISNLKYSHGHFIRVNIPDDIELHSSGSGYSTIWDQNENRTIHELGCDCYILYNNKWRKFNWLKQLEPCLWFRVLEHIFGLRDCYDTIGWTDDIEYYKKWWWSEKIPTLDDGNRKYPSFKEDKKGLKLKVNLDKSEKTIEFLRSGYGEDKWLKFYDDFDKQLKENPNKEIWCE